MFMTINSFSKTLEVARRSGDDVVVHGYILLAHSNYLYLLYFPDNSTLSATIK